MRFFDDYNKAFPAAPAPAESQQATSSGSITRQDLEDLTKAIKESILNDLRSSQDNLDQIKAGAPAENKEPEKEE